MDQSDVAALAAAIAFFSIAAQKLLRPHRTERRREQRGGIFAALLGLAMLSLMLD